MSREDHPDDHVTEVEILSRSRWLRGVDALKRLNHHRDAEQHQADRPEAQQSGSRRRAAADRESARVPSRMRQMPKARFVVTLQARFIDCHVASSSGGILQAAGARWCPFSANGPKPPANIRLPRAQSRGPIMRPCLRTVARLRTVRAKVGEPSALLLSPAA